MCWEAIGACVLRLPTNTNKNYKTGIFKIHIMQDARVTIVILYHHHLSMLAVISVVCSMLYYAKVYLFCLGVLCVLVPCALRVYCSYRL